MIYSYDNWRLFRNKKFLFVVTQSMIQHLNFYYFSIPARLILGKVKESRVVKDLNCCLIISTRPDIYKIKPFNNFFVKDNIAIRDATHQSELIYF